MLNIPENRTYLESHPWIDFQLDVSQATYILWMLLGESRSKCEHIAGVPLSPERARTLYNVYLSKGVHATTSIEGNTLTERQVRQLLEGSLKLPLSQKYLADEVQNIIEACNEIAKETLEDSSSPISVERICRFNELVLRGLEPGEDVVPGQVRTHEVGVLRYRGAPWKDCRYLLDRLCDWLNSGFNTHEPDTKFALLLFKAIMAHLYLAWIHPFGDGNGRTARLLEFQILIQSGVPFPAAQLLSNHYNTTRTRYYVELDKSSKSPLGVNSFIQYAVQGFVDGLREQIEFIRNQQIEVTWENFVHQEFRGKDSIAKTRQKHLILAMTDEARPQAELADLTPEIIRAYASRGEKTLTRDLNALVGMGLVLKKKDHYAANRAKILAFLPPQIKDSASPP